MSEVMEFKSVSKSFGPHAALQDIDWSVESGSIHGLIGANGSGKTTLLRLALGVLWPDAGSIHVLGQAVLPRNTVIRHEVHYVGAGQMLPPRFRVHEWLQFMGLLYSRWDAKRMRRFIDALEIDPKAGVRSLSTGMQASLRIAAAAACRPEVLLLDEATNGMDVVVKNQVLQLLMDMAATEGTTLVIATHTIDDVERLADSVSVLYRGRMVMDESLDAVKGHMCRLQVAVGADWSPAVLVHPQVLDVEWQGHVAMVTIDGPAPEWSHRLMHAGALVAEPVDMTLTEIFAAVLKREGYTRDALAWDA